MRAFTVNYLQQTQLLAFEFEKHFLRGETAAKSCKAAVAADDAVAWNNDGNGIAPVRQSHRANSFGIADALGELRVENRFSIGNRAQGIPHAKLKGRSFHRQRQIKFLQFAADVRLQLADDFGKCGAVLFPVGWRRRCTLAALETDSTQRMRIPRAQQSSNVALERGIEYA